jgi:hypothetical protein
MAKQQRKTALFLLDRPLVWGWEGCQTRDACSLQGLRLGFLSEVRIT